MRYACPTSHSKGLPKLHTNRIKPILFSSTEAIQMAITIRMSMDGRGRRRIPRELGGRMVSRRMLESSLLVDVLPIRAAGHRVAVPEETSATHFWDQEVDYIVEGLWEGGVGLSKVK